MRRALLILAVLGLAAAGRPPPAERKFVSKAIDKIIDDYKQRLRDPEIAMLFENCYPNTLDTTIDAHNATDTFVITGDIPAMWLRDSTNQVLPYVEFAKQDEALRIMLRGVVNRQLNSVLLDPYANAFNVGPNGHGHQNDARTPRMTPPVFEGKYELDSLAAVIKLAYAYWNTTKDNTLLNNLFLSSMEKLMETVIEQQKSTQEDGPTPAYSFFRLPFDVYPDILAPANRTGLSKCGFRPSDDRTLLPFLLPSNAMMAVELGHLAIMATAMGGARALRLAASARTVEGQIRRAIDAFAVRSNVMSFEIDGFGRHVMMDDSNVPDLLSLSYLGFCTRDSPLCKATRAFSLSKENPWFFKGKAGEGLGGPHVGIGWIWPMSIIMRAMTSTDDAEIVMCLNMLKVSAAGTGFMHESFWMDDPSRFTRPWFAWANALFGELIIQLSRERPHLVF